MTARLKDQQQFADRDEAEAARLLARLSPSEPDPIMESRVYARLTAQAGRRAESRQRRWVVACVGLLLVSTTILAAALVPGRLAKPRPTSNVSTTSTVELAAPRAPGAERATEVAGLSPPTAALSGAHTPAHPVHPGTPRRRPAGPGAPAAKHDEAAAPEPQGSPAQTSSSEARMAAAPSEEATMVLAALRALRREHAPVKAGALLDQYLARFPRGVLVEEALALGMEAALARNDAAAATGLADRYLRRYPGGRFTGLARQAMGSKTP